MHSTTVTETTFELEGSDRFIWAKTGGKYAGREFTATQVKIETSTDPARSAQLRISGPWLTPLAHHDSEWLRLNGWEACYEDWDLETARRMPALVLELAASAGFVIAVDVPV